MPETITPERALELLSTVELIWKQADYDKVEMLRLKMASGEWDPAGEPIMLDLSGTLHDGCHRLTAIVIHGRPVDLIVNTKDFDEGSLMHAEAERMALR